MVIPNPITRPDIDLNPAQGAPYRLMAVGRLTPQKGFDRLIKAFAQVAPRHPDWVLDIWGEGAERDRLQRQIDAGRLNGRITLPGNSERQGEWARHAAAFALSSRWEGFPNVLGEAMACGLPVVACDCAFGPREMIRHGYDGLLVEHENIAALSRALDRVMSNEKLRHTLGRNACGSARRFAPEVVATQWDELLRRLTSATRLRTGPRRGRMRVMSR